MVSIAVEAYQIAMLLEVSNEIIGATEIGLFYQILKGGYNIVSVKQMAHALPMISLANLMTAFIQCDGSEQKTIGLLTQLHQSIPPQLNGTNEQTQAASVTHYFTNNQSGQQNFPAQNHPQVVTPTFDQDFSQRTFSFSEEDDLRESSAPHQVPITPTVEHSSIPVKGRFTEEEKAYAEFLIQKFRDGVLPLRDGMVLCQFISKMLNCTPGRVSKKFSKTVDLSARYTHNTDAIKHMTIEQIQTLRAELRG